MPTPAVILVRPQLGENIGAVARAMMNFGLSELRIVAPRDGWPNQRAIEVSSGAGHIIESAQIFPDLPSAAHDIHLLYATTARPRDMEKRAVTSNVALKEIHTSSERCALVFGPERTGLENEEISFCDTIVSIPTSPDHPSLNIAQSAVIMGYEWWQCHSEQSEESPGDPSAMPQDDKLATKGEMQGLFEQLEKILDESNYYRVEHKKPIMWQNMQTMLLRGRWSSQEVQSFRGMLRVLWEGRKPRN
jgi:tRNA/rRNA methyltransferase